MNFHKIVFISIFSLVINSSVIFAEEHAAPTAAEVQQVKADLAAQVSASQRETYVPTWQKDFNNLHIQAAALLEENARLSRENGSFQAELARLQKEIEEQENKNRSLREDVDIKKELLSGKSRKKDIHAQQQLQKRIADKNEKLAQYNRKIDIVDRKIALGKMKLKTLDTNDDTDQILVIEEELDRDHAELAENDHRVAELKEEIEHLSVDDKELNPAVLNLKEEIDTLQLDVAALEKRGPTGDVVAPAPVVALNVEEKISDLTKKKETLQADLQEIQEKMTKIKNSQEMGIVNKRVKDLVETISEIDAENEQMREGIKYLQENIVILKSHVKKLEYQSEAVNSMKGKMGTTEHFKTVF